MARTLTGYVVDLPLTEAGADAYGGLVWGAGLRERATWRLLSAGASLVQWGTRRERFGDRVELRPTDWGATPEYTEGVAGAVYLATYTRTLPRAKSWAAIELLYSEPDGTSVGFGLYLAGSYYRWTGAAWAAFDPTDPALWNTEAEVVTGFPSWTGTSVAVAFRLSTSDSDETPTVFGARAMARIWAPGGFSRDIVLETLMPAIRDVRVPVRISLDAEGGASLSLDGLREYGLDDPAPGGGSLLTPIAVHNLDDDPGETADLFSAWNAATHVITLTAPQDAGDTLLVDAEAEPLVQRVTHEDYLELSRFPAVVVESVRLRTEGWRGQPRAVRDTAGGAARVVQRPTPVRVDLDLRVVAGYDVDVQTMLGAMDEQLTGRAFSRVTGAACWVRRKSDWSVDAGLGARATWEMYDAVSYAGADSSAYLVAEVEVEPAA